MARVPETDIAIPALEAARDAGGTITTTQLIKAMAARFQPAGRDADILADRNDTYFSQKVRNLISHRDSSTSIIKKGYAIYDASTESITITPAGLSFLN